MKGWRIVSVEIPSTNIALDAKGGSYVVRLAFLRNVF